MADDPIASALAETRRATRDQVAAVWQAQMERLRDAMSREWQEQAARIIEDRFTQFEMMLKPRMLESRREVVRSFGRHWYECFARMSQAASDREWCDSLLDAAAGLCRHCAFFSVKTEAIYYQGSRGYDPPLTGVPGEIPVQSAAAFLEVVLSGISSETRRTPWDLSPALAAVFGDPDGKALLVPVSNGDRVVGVLYAENAIEAAALDAMALVAGIVLGRHMRSPDAMRPSSIVRAMAQDEGAPLAVDAPAKPKPATGGDPRAVRAARVAASKLLMDHYATVRAGQERGDVYTPLKAEIEALRQHFDYPPAYLDAELVRTLAKGKPEWLRR